MSENSLTYGETRSVSLGDYEQFSCFLKLTTNVKRVGKNVNIEITDSEAANLDDFKKDFNNTFKLVSKAVRARLDERENEVREWAKNHVSFEKPEDKYPRNRGW